MPRAPSPEDRLCALIDRSEELAAGFMQLDMDLRALAQDWRAELVAVRQQAEAETRLALEAGTPRRRLTAVPPAGAR